MKTQIHPTYYTDTIVICSCGNKFTTGATVTNIAVEVCYKCHPFYTGEQRFLDAKGRVERFQKKQQVAETYQASKASKKKSKTDKSGNEPKSLRELLSTSK